MRVLVYVEGPSDKASMQALLGPIIDQKKQKGIAINFFDAPAGDKKESVLTKVPKKAVNIVLNDPHCIVVAMPDLYPRNKAFPHETFEELKTGILRNFESALKDKNINDARLSERFKVFCFKHDLEALLLASGIALQQRLESNSLRIIWKTPVEDQNHGNPPKRIVERLFEEQQKNYRDTVDAPMILKNCDYREIASHCPQCFKPFVEFLEGL